MPDAVLPVASVTTGYGATNPDRLPIDVINANPVATVAPLRNAVGKFQNSGMVVTMPVIEAISATNDHIGVAQQYAQNEADRAEQASEREMLAALAGAVYATVHHEAAAATLAGILNTKAIYGESHALDYHHHDGSSQRNPQ